MTKRIFLRKILLTPNFFNVFAKHLDKMFPNGWIYDIEEQKDVICAVDSTAGWAKALYYTCTELNISDVYSYWNELDWEYSDILDGKLSELLCAIVYDENNKRIRYEQTI